MIFIRNNDRDQRVIIPQEFCPVESQELSLAHFHFNTDPVIMRLHRPLSRIKCIQLALRILRCGIFMASPVIQDLRNMMDLFRSRMFHTTEDKVIILRSVKLSAQHSDLINQRFLRHKQMADIIDRTQQIHVIIRFEMWLEELVSVHRHLIFIRI